MKRKVFRSKNWESNIYNVTIEPCPVNEDPLGYHAVFLQGAEDTPTPPEKAFAIGASYLNKRAENLQKAGYKAPMTVRAISMMNAILQDKNADIAAC